MSDNGGNSQPAQKLIVIRTHYVDQHLMQTARELALGNQYEVLFAIDESAATCDAGEFGKISVTPEALSIFGLHAPDSRAYYFAGDYILYLARFFRPKAQFIWMMEHDVLVNFEDIRQPFLKLDELSPDDFLTSHLSEAPENWFWRKTMYLRYPSVYRCFFPLVRMSAGAIDHLLAERRADGGCYARLGADYDRIPNDEAFCATILKHGSFTVEDMNRYLPLYDPEAFAFDSFFDREQLPSHDDRLYHSVLAGQRYSDGLLRRRSKGGS